MRKSELEKIKLKKEIEKIENEIIQMQHTRKFQNDMVFIARISLILGTIGGLIGGILKILGYKL